MGLVMGLVMGAEGLQTETSKQPKPVSRGSSSTKPDETPYQSSLWNRVHRELFLRTGASGGIYSHELDPLLYRGGTYLLKGEKYQSVIKHLDALLVSPGDLLREPLMERFYFQRDLWAVFDYLSWYPDDWVHQSRDEMAARNIRVRLARIIGSLSHSMDEIKNLPDNYRMAVDSGDFSINYGIENPGQSFLPPGLFDRDGSWVRIHDLDPAPMAGEHFEESGGRAAHVIFIRLPGGRAETENYLETSGGERIQPFPEGTMVAMIRRAMAIDQSWKLYVTPVTELVQIRVYRRISNDSRANLGGDFGAQDVYEFILDRSKLFSGSHGLRPVKPGVPAHSFRRSTSDPFDLTRPSTSGTKAETQLQSCIQCHQAPGIHSVLSMQRGLNAKGQGNFTTYRWDVEMNFSIRAKASRFDWGLLQGMLEVQSSMPFITEE